MFEQKHSPGYQNFTFKSSIHNTPISQVSQVSPTPINYQAPINSVCSLIAICVDLTCKRGSVGHSEKLLIPRSSVWFRPKPEN